MRAIEIVATIMAVALGVLLALVTLCVTLFMETFGLALANAWLIETTGLHLFP